MLRVTVELIPFGVGKPEIIGTMVIANDGTARLAGDGKKGNYQYEIWGKRRGKVWKEGRVLNFPRLRKNVWHLVKLILEDAL